MAITVEEHVSFWEGLRSRIGTGVPLLRAIEEIEPGLPAGLKEAAAGMASEIRNGLALSDAMERHAELFTLSVRTMVRAGEAGGVLDVIMERISKALADGSFAPPGAETREGVPEAGEMARMWRGFAWLISSGVPILKTLEILAEESPAAGLRGALVTVRKGIADGGAMASTLEDCPELFAERIIAAVRWGEKAGRLEEACFKIADAIEAASLASLPAERGSAEAESTLDPDENAPPVVKVVNRILLDAINGKATDIHIEPPGAVRIRIDGALQEHSTLPERLFPAVISRMKIMSALDIAERRRPQDGIILLTVNDQPVKLRVNVIPTTHGESVVIRIMADGRRLIGLDDSGLSDADLKAVRSVCARKEGVILVTGPSWSGKSTTLFALLKEMATATRCVVTIEDPVEVELDGVEQVQISPRIGLTYAHALRSAMRHDADTILVGEIRDLETADIIFRAGIQGHLVLSMLHTSTSTVTVRRLIDLGLDPFQINAALGAVISQRLVRRLCPSCRTEAPVPEDTLPPEAVELLKSSGSGKVFVPGGCGECRDGYRHRAMIYELLVPDDGFRRALTGGAGEDELRSAAVAAGMRSIFLDGIDRAARGVTSVEEVCRAAWDCR